LQISGLLQQTFFNSAVQEYPLVSLLIVPVFFVARLQENVWQQNKMKELVIFKSDS